MFYFFYKFAPSSYVRCSLLYMKSFNLNKEKAVNSLLFVVNQLEKADAHKTYKILYFADQIHLVRYGRPIIGDTYLKMQYGPVPSFIKYVVDNQITELENVVSKYGKHFIKPLKEVNLDYLSESDIECLTESINENKNLVFDDLTDKSHDEAYEKAEWEIDYFDIAKAIGADESILMYINQQMVNDNIRLA